MHHISRDGFHRFVGVVVALFASASLLWSYGVSLAAADPLTKADIEDVASATWFGSSFASVASNPGQSTVANIGDINGDGRDDVAVTKTTSAVDVIFTPPSGFNDDVAVADLKPSQGYEVRVQAGPVHSVAGVGDQNGDGVPDIAIGQTNQSRVTVAYGVPDPSVLPTCATGTSKCLDATVANLTLANGFVLTGPAGSNFGGSIAPLGNFRASDTNDFAVGAMYAGAGTGTVYVISESLDPASTPFDITTADASKVLTLGASQTGATLGSIVNELGDFNGDGFADLYVLETAGGGSNPARGYVIYGGDSLPNPIDLSAFSAASGFLLSPPILPFWRAVNAGDINGDGRLDLVAGGVSTTSPTGSAAVIYGPDEDPTDPISLISPTAEEGYAITPGEGETNGNFGAALAAAGDLNGDGVPDQIFSAQAAEVGANSAAGAVSIVFGQRPSPTSPVELGPDLTPDRGVALVGPSANARLGGGLASVGDIDRDGLPDYMVGSAGQSRVYLVLGSSLIGQARTGLAGAIGSDHVTLGGTGTANGRESSAYFEYGTSDAYGNQTAEQSVGESSTWRQVDADVTGLSPETEIHYRLVIENDLGLKSYGADRTFTTAAEPVDPCEPDNTQPGCSGWTVDKYCQDHPTDEGCLPGRDPEKFCEANPAASICKQPVASLSDLIANSGSAKVRRGKKTTIWAWITSTGTKSADGVKVCATAPKSKAKLVGKKCRTVGSLAPGKTAKVKFKVKVKARKGAKVKVKLTASGQGVSNKTAMVRFAVR
jgi:hypothetical protein